MANKLKFLLLRQIAAFAVICCTSANLWSQSVPWYHQTSIYQIYPRSFFDTDGDGIGDLKGIISRLDYIKGLGFETIWISPFFVSPQADFGYDISDFKAVASEYGNMEDAELLIAETHRRGMRIVFDMVMNHTSDQHAWFKKDLKREGSDYYLWADKKNNWKGVAGTGWQFNKDRNQYYYTAFLPFQPDLNYRNPEVKNAMLNNVRFWLNKGVDGYRLDIFNSIYEDSLLRKNPNRFKPIYTNNRPESLAFAEELRAVCDSFGERMLIGEIIGNRAISRKYCGDKVNNRLTLAFNFEMLRFKFKAKYFHNLVRNIELDFVQPFVPTYVFSNHDRRRSLSRLHHNLSKAKLLHLFQLTVRGVPCMYYGEEIGMTDYRMPYRKALDPIPHYLKIPRFMVDMAGETLNRDEMRTPMQWNKASNGGFSSAEKTWLPVNPNFKVINADEQASNTGSLLNEIRTLMDLRSKNQSLSLGSLKLIESRKMPANMMGYYRNYEGQEILVLLNFSRLPKEYAVDGDWEILYSLNQSELNADHLAVFPAYGGLVLKRKI